MSTTYILQGEIAFRLKPYVECLFHVIQQNILLYKYPMY